MTGTTPQPTLPTGLPVPSAPVTGAAYLPGPWWAAVGPDALVVVEPDAAPALVRRLWAAVAVRAGLLDLLEVLADGGLGSLPDFAAVELVGGTARVAARGVLVRVTGDEDAGTPGADVPVVAVDGRGALTWSERSVPGADAVLLRADVADVAPAEAWWPVTGGVLRVGALRLGPVAAVVVASAPVVVASVPGHDVVVPERTTVAEVPVAGIPVAEVPAEVPAEGTPAEEIPAEEIPAEEIPAEETPAEETPDDEVAAVDAADHRGAADEVRADDDVPGVATDDVVPDALPLEDTVHVAAAADEAGTPTGLHPLVLDDHDGMTILTEELDEIRRLLPGWAAEHAPAVASPPAVPRAATSGTADASVPGVPVAVADLDALLEEAPAPALPPAGAVEPGPVLPRHPVLELSTGTLVPLDRPVLVGRAPQVTQATRSGLPRLVAVPSPTHDVSRTHAQVHAEGPLVLVTDLHSTNGVVVRGHGEEVLLEPGRPTPVTDTDVVDLGDGATLRVRWED